MINAYKNFWKNYTNFYGKATRSDYWLVVLANFLIYLIPTTLLIIILSTSISASYYGEPSTGAIMSCIGLGILMFVYFVATLVANVAIQIRRLRDAGLPWGLFFLNFIPYIGGLVTLVLYCMPSSKTDFKSTSINVTKVVEKSEAEKLKEWEQLFEAGTITQEEYDKKKKELLN
ncbi:MULTISPECIES: DUF805 domain-containing protein [unclassified Enterococcus]|uniref:DUF805 domain-containing protein n=1 Tax=unclassified Enterococcus TaxID=2608891 RepID=UPI001551C8C0|nr:MULTISPECIES: DUF805 domain-containing protein [unclassified Enterococcus]MBS7578028.1 DUF805 domain-containing protein [Enterococcus sp. MMGLQ5-2]MBS7585282.1 DUF805 domain-containing protein [Enterococcus sp. MMGLQ5-1]NPD13139.1 DUF805 domain-containing protein [Enterococcus sp. MMGLQ5-1]NPD37859.1 DUF805 domain-containing protein [Enterococcus sp. MMGLQ5-2]